MENILKIDEESLLKNNITEIIIKNDNSNE